MIPYKEVKLKSRRINDKANQRLHPFASRVSIYFSWIFINLGLSPNQVTAIFFFVGLIGALLILGIKYPFIIASYFLFRLHIIIDVSDGEVARFTKKFSINGSYWDSMIHAVLYPLYFACMAMAQYKLYEDVQILYLGMFGVLTYSLLLASKNNYYRAMLFNKYSLEEMKRKSDKIAKSGIRFLLFLMISEILSFEGLFIGYIFLTIIPDKSYALLLLLFYAVMFGLFAIVKFYWLSKRGFYLTKS